MNLLIFYGSEDGLPVVCYCFSVGGVGCPQKPRLYAEAVADYRQTILTAVKEVEDSLTQIQSRKEQAAAVDRAVDSARRQMELAKARYSAGASTYCRWRMPRELFARNKWSRRNCAASVTPPACV